MAEYTVIAGQNILDVALHIYGSIEGIVDLMMNNPSLSLAGTLRSGDALEYSDGFVINPGIVAHYRMNGIVPANGERNVYFKQPAFPKVAQMLVDNKATSAGFSISGAGQLEIDWGDNSPLQPVSLSNIEKALEHTFDNAVAGNRKIILYGDFSIRQADFSGLEASRILLFRPVTAEKFRLANGRLDPCFLPLFQEIYDLNLSGIKTASLLPLLENKKLMKLDLSGINVWREALDEYLIALVKKHGGRRSCTVILTEYPSGEYGEPLRDENGNYLVLSGMEAVWLLCNEPAWNEAGYWKFIIDGHIYISGSGS